MVTKGLLPLSRLFGWSQKAFCYHPNTETDTETDADLRRFYKRLSCYFQPRVSSPSSPLARRIESRDRAAAPVTRAGVGAMEGRAYRLSITSRSGTVMA